MKGFHAWAKNFPIWFSGFSDFRHVGQTVERTWGLWDKSEDQPEVPEDKTEALQEEY